MRVAVVGLGSIGRRHLENLRSLGCDAIAVRRAPGDGELSSLADAVAWGADAAVIATPTSLHADTLRWAVEHGLHTYVEKPIASSSAGLAETLELAAAQKLVVATGYNLRFHPALEAARQAIVEGRIGTLLSVRAEIGQYLPDWHPDEDYRTSYAARSELGGGALLTLSHELDHTRWIAGEVVACTGIARRRSLEVDVDTLAEVVCEHESGAVSSVHADLHDRAYNRRARWVGERGSIAWEWDGPALLLPAGETLWADREYDAASTYRAALEDFLRAVERGGEPRCDGRAGLRVVELCEAVAA